MKSPGLFSILKSIKMRPSGYDDGSRRDFERGRMSSGAYFGSSSRPFGGEYERGYGGGYGGGYGSGYEGGYGGGNSHGHGGGIYSRGNDYYRNGRSQSVPGRYDDRYSHGDQYNRDQYNLYDQRRRNQSGGNRFDSYRSPERFDFSRNGRTLSGPGYSRAYNDSGFDGRQRDRFQDPYSDQHRSSGSYGQRYASDRNFSQDRMDRFGSGYDRYGQSFGYGQNQMRGSARFGSPSRRSLYDCDQGSYGRYGRSSGHDRYASGSGRFSSGNHDRHRPSIRFGRGKYSEYDGYGNGIHDQYTNRGNGFQQSRSGYPERRSYPSADRFTQGSRVRFDGERDDYRRRYFSADRARRPSVSDNFPRRDFGRFDDRHDNNFGRKYGDDAGFSRESRYQTDGMSNMNRKFEALPGERMQRNIRGGRSSSVGGTSERRFDMQGGNDYQGGGQYGTQASNDRMPPPIPPFTEPRSNYPNTMALTWYEDSDRFNQNSSNRCRELAVRASYDLMRRRYYENAADPSQNPTWLQRGGFGNAYNMSNISPDVLRIDFVDFYSVDNAKENRTYDYEMVRDQEQPNPVLRRGESFRMSMLFRDREFDSERDNIFLNFYFGPSPSVPKRTRIVLPVTMNTGKEFERAPHQWDCRFQGQEGNKINIEVFVPATCPVGMWRCVVETALRESQSSRLQYRCSEDIYFLFNPFCRNDAVWMENDAQRFEYTMNDNGKVYTGGYRNVRGRPWIYGQFDDCVLPAACLLLEMSGLPHSERGNSAKVARALASMIKATKNQRGGLNSFFDSSSKFGLVEAKYEDDFRGGNTPHLWTGSVQIIEEFLRGGATPVKYAQCWVISALMTTLCRALGLPSRPVTAYVSAMETQDSLTVDRYVDRFGDVIEQGPAQDQPDSIWSFHTWSDVWMNRPDLPQVYSGWQATDPCRTFRDFRDLFSGACGPCPVEALRRGDVGQRDDVDAFYASLNAYVRYFYEDDESGWGYSPFRQFRYPMSRYILTKAVGRYDEEGDNDCDDLTNVYRDNERTDAERFGIFNSCRGFLNMPPFEYQAAAYNWGPFNPTETDQSNFDVSFELDAPEPVIIGQAMTVPVVITNSSPEPRNIQTNICTRSCFYTGVCGPYLKRSSTQMILAPNQTETITLTLDPWDYQEKLVDMAFVKITVTSFVQETGQSFIDEFDFRFSKPRLNIDVGELRVGTENDATFSFVNPLDVPLTDCFLTMEVSGSVRPRTIRISQEVGPREVFSYRQTFTPRLAGDHRMVACFASRQLQDVVGQRPVVVRGTQ